MQRAIAVIAAFAGCTLAGWSMSERLRRRCAALSELIAVLERISLEVAHTNRPVAALLEGAGGRETGAMLASISGAIRAGATAAEAWGERLRRGETPRALEERERAVLTAFFAVLGTSDRFSQRRNAEAALSSLRLCLVVAERAYAGKGRVCRAMGLLLGAGVSILML